MTVETSRAASGRGLKWALGLSLALNLVILGFLGGSAWRLAGPEGGHRDMRATPASYGAAFVRALPQREQRRLHRDLRRQGEGLPSRAERRALYGEMLELLRADRFEPDRARAIFDRQADTAHAVQTRAQAGWLRIVEEMSAAERAEVANRLEKVLARGPHRR